MRILEEIVARARPLHERLHGASVGAGLTRPSGMHPTLERWCETVTNGDAALFHRRLAWDGLDAASVSAALDSVPAAAPASLPDWAALLGAAYGIDTAPAVGGIEIAPDDRALDPREPLPFEEILLPVVRCARERLRDGASGQDRRLDAAAHGALERILLRRLTRICAPALFARYSVRRASTSASALAAFLGPAGAGPPRDGYGRFLREMADGGLLEFFRVHSVAARLVGTVAMLWLDATIEFIERLSRDWTDLEATFSPERPLGRVVAARGGVSDFHHGGRAVLILTFDSGTRVVYKPRPLAIERFFAEILAWHNAKPDVLPLRSPAMVDRATHGWLEFVERAPCEGLGQVERYFERCGMLLALAYALNGSDFHYENLIAAGEHPMLIDLEMLLGPRFNLVERTPSQAFGAEGARERVLASVLNVQMLPRWKAAPDGVLVNTGALGAMDGPIEYLEVKCWRDANTDTMKLVRERLAIPRFAPSLPEFDGRPVSAASHVDALVAGFTRMYRLLAASRDELLRQRGPIARLRSRPLRFILRNTSLYEDLLERCLHPRYLVDGIARGVQLDVLCRPFLTLEERPAIWPVLQAEREALERMDIPFLQVDAGSTALTLATGETVPDCFERDACDEAVRRLRGLNEDDLALQTELIMATFRANAAQGLRIEVPAAGTAAPRATAVASAELRARTVAEAVRIAEVLRKRAIVARGEPSWLGVQYLSGARRFEVGATSCYLFDGYTGIAFFLAALEAATGGAGFRDLALAAVRPLCDHLPGYERMFRLRRRQELGIGTGLGSLLYALPYIAAWLDAPYLLDTARSLAALVPPDAELADGPVDVIGGTAGLLLGLLHLHRCTGDGGLLERAAELGRILLRKRCHDPSTDRLVWPTGPADRPETGFAHGQAGIACALWRCGKAVGEGTFIDAADEAASYERLILGADLSANGDADVTAAWSRGAAGIGLSRLEALAARPSADAREDVEAAIRRTRAHLLDGTDTLCTGAAGRLDFLLAAGRVLGRPELGPFVDSAAGELIHRARNSGSYRTGWEPVLHIGLFMGVPGIAYELLRIGHPDRLPSVLRWG